MLTKMHSLKATSAFAGFCAGTFLTAAVVYGGQWRPVDAAPAVSPVTQVAQVAKYQPSAGDAGVQIRRARNAAMGEGAAASGLIQACPRCR